LKIDVVQVRENLSSFESRVNDADNEQTRTREANRSPNRGEFWPS
jgi:hypothetical protein